jgi:hypothetical protein
VEIKEAVRPIRVTKVHFPGFPVEVVGVEDVHAAFLNESRPPGRIQRSVLEKSRSQGIKTRLLTTDRRTRKTSIIAAE